ncbi:MAG: 16S rRNA (cytosine(1402)-N(4))-methyltransferase RsmH [Bacillota bacterium]|nr:16S rRNA (cytosine(1402)-N(4))-methyltransferase RsmH [Bacillota bacterium]
MSGEFRHIPVLADEVLKYLSPVAGGTYIDGTLGGGGHAELILQRIGEQGRLLGVDRDRQALAAAAERLQTYGDSFCAVHGRYAEMVELAAARGVTAADGILLDIGVSSYQLDQAERGFSYMADAPLDMRMDRGEQISAADIVNDADERQLTQILFAYGEEKWAKRIAGFIVEARAQKRIETTGELTELIKKAIPKGAREAGQHPAKRSFQALRIAVNGELEQLKQGIDAAVSLLKPGGVLVVISFHSLEDRIVKNSFRYHASDCICPPQLPACVCGHHAELKLLNKAPVMATQQEIDINPRARSARLRAARKL